jgi:hypothetical protein
MSYSALLLALRKCLLNSVHDAFECASKEFEVEEGSIAEDRHGWSLLYRGSNGDSLQSAVRNSGRIESWDESSVCRYNLLLPNAESQRRIPALIQLRQGAQGLMFETLSLTKNTLDLPPIHPCGLNMICAIG